MVFHQPYLVTRVLCQIELDNSSIYPAKNQEILCDFYVDDLLTSANTVEKATLLQLRK